MADFLRDQNGFLEQEVDKHARALGHAGRHHPGHVLDGRTRDNETGNHILRTQRYVRCLARLQDHCYATASAMPTIQLLYKSAPLHDIGKVGHSRPHPAQARRSRPRSSRS
jgi:putative two-component system response regulator